MKIITTWTATIILILATLAFATPPKTINYQGYLSSKGIPATGPLSMTFSLYSSNPARKNPVWQETQLSVPVTNGIYSVQLGSENQLKGQFDVPYYLGVLIEGDTEMSLQPLSSVPYALRAITADDASSVGGQTLTSLDSRYLDPTRPKPTPLQIATLRWDQARSDFSSLTNVFTPMALAYDGKNIWVASRNNNNVTKINPSTGTLGVPIAVGTYPRSLVFDGNSIWVANQNSNTVQKINPETGVAGAPITVGTTPFALAFDGSSIWVANYGSNSVQKINPVTGVAGAPITVGRSPAGLAFDGASIWVANYLDNSIQKINPVTSATVGLPISVGANPIALAFDGSSIWVANYIGNSVMKVNPGTGAVGPPIVVGSYPGALTFDGSSIWVANYSDNSVQKINPATGIVGAPIAVGIYPQGMAFDGSNIWVANTGSGVTKLTAAAEPVGVQTVGTDQIAGIVAAAKLDLSTVVAKSGDAMTGQLVLSASGLKFSDGSTQVTAKSDCSGGRYEDNGDGTVSDCRTGLVWLKDANCLETSGGIEKLTYSYLSWASAVAWSAGLGDGTCGLGDNSSPGDWRLPTKTEWLAMVASALKQGISSPTITNRTGTTIWTQGDVFNNIQFSDVDTTYWSSSTHASDTGSAWYVNIHYGYMNYGEKWRGRYVWPVRAGQ